MVQCGLEPVKTYYPVRRMTLYHLSNVWLRGRLPVHSAWLRQRVVPMILRDIVAVIGRKPAA